MNNNDLKKHIAETAYNVGYAAKLHFSSFELNEKLPSLISFISISCGIYALVYDELSTKFASSTLVILGVIGIYVSLKSNNDQDFKAKGDELTDLFNELKHLMAEIKQQPNEAKAVLEKLKNIEERFNKSCASHHIIFSTWLAHYKFFAEQQIGWIEEYKTFNFWKDKVPLTFWVSMFGLLVFSIFGCTGLFAVLCQALNFKGGN